jgi:hypothetical protein
MPKNFNSPEPQMQAQTQAPLESAVMPEAEKPIEHKTPTLYDAITVGLSREDVNALDTIRKDIQANEFIVKCLFSEDAMLDIKINKHVKIAARVLSTEERDNLEGYLYAKDIYKLYADEDEGEIKAIMSEANLDFANAKDLFLRTFPKGVAQSRYVKTAVALSVMKINGKNTGNTLLERFHAISKLPAILTQQIQGYLTLFERAIKLELSDEESLKN